MAQEVLQRLRKATRRPDELSPSDFATSAGSQGTETIVAQLVAETALAIRNGPIKLAIPAYESFETAGDGSQQTFNLSHGIADSPDTQDVVHWFEGDYQGVPTYDPDANNGNGTITVDGPGAVETVHVFYLSPKPATVVMKKETANENKRQELYEGNAGLVHQTNQSEQPERIDLPGGPRRFIATDMEFQITVDAPYVTRFEDPDGNGATATNALLQIGVNRADRTVKGLGRVIANTM